MNYPEMLGIVAKQLYRHDLLTMHGHLPLGWERGYVHVMLREQATAMRLNKSAQELLASLGYLYPGTNKDEKEQKKDLTGDDLWASVVAAASGKTSAPLA